MAASTSRLLHDARQSLRSGPIDRSFSRDETPEGRQPAFAEDHTASWRDPSPPHAKAAFACSILLDPQPSRLTLRLAFPSGSATGFPRSAWVPPWVRSGLSAEGTSSATGAACAPVPAPVPCGASVSAPSACLTSRRFHRPCTAVDHPRLSSPPTALVLAVVPSAHAPVTISPMRFHCPSSFAPHRYQ